MALSASDPETVIRALPIWNGGIDIQPVLGGITNKNYLVTDGERRAVVRFGGDIPVHGVMRFNELAATRSAALSAATPARQSPDRKGVAFAISDFRSGNV